MNFITLEDLAEIVGITKNSLRVYLAHFTLNRFTTRRNVATSVKFKKQNKLVFLVNNESLQALEKYLMLKERNIECIKELRDWLKFKEESDYALDRERETSLENAMFIK